MNEQEQQNRKQEAMLLGFSNIQDYAEYRVEIKRILRRVGQEVEDTEATTALLQRLRQLDMTSGKISPEDYTLSRKLYERAIKRGLIA